MNRISPARLLMASLIAVAPAAPVRAEIEVVPRSEVRLQPLNPLRGDASPKAGVLWGDIKKRVATGTLIEFVEGFSSPPHIHNITYRAVVITGSVHNDDPDAARLWMGPGSFWTQPAGETHITATPKGVRSTAFLEIFDGPYLVRPRNEEFDNGERPVNIEARNIVWLDPADVTWIDMAGAAPGDAGPQLAFLWGAPRDGEKNGGFLKLPAGFEGELKGTGALLRAVTVKGTTRHRVPGEDETKTLDPGSYFGSKGAAAHEIACADGADCVLYISAEGRYGLKAR